MLQKIYIYDKIYKKYRIFITEGEIMSCIFCKIIDGTIPSKKVYEDDEVLAFHDINPQAPVHVLVIPKCHIESANAVTNDNSKYVAAIFEKLPKIASVCGLTNGYRIISNCGPDACQTVPHLHFHILGGVKLPEKMS